MKQWSPYVVGAGIGVLSWFTFLVSRKALGCSTAYVRTAGMIEKFFRGGKTLARLYYQKYKPAVDWQWMLVLGIFLGALLSALLSGSWDLRWVPPLWRQAFAGSVYARLAVAFCGGALMGFGARWAGGCTSGHGISGAMQLAVGSWITTICMFAGGMAVAFLLYGGR